jgi:hypothetical protein
MCMYILICISDHVRSKCQNILHKINHELSILRQRFWLRVIDLAVFFPRPRLFPSKLTHAASTVNGISAESLPWMIHLYPNKIATVPYIVYSLVLGLELTFLVKIVIHCWGVLTWCKLKYIVQILWKYMDFFPYSTKAGLKMTWFFF